MMMLLPAGLAATAGAAKPVRESVAEAKPPWRETLLVGGAHGAVVLDVGGVHVGGERGDERVEDISGERD